MGGNDTGIRYDENGNIINLTRSWGGSTIDNLAYTYKTNSNVLDNINDTGNNPSEPNEFFKDGITTYDYDNNGNQTKNSGKGINSIDYNYLNLPTNISTNSGNYTYTYSASSQKLSSLTPATGGAQGGLRDYIAGLVYDANGLEFIPTPEGRALPINRITNSIPSSGLYYRYEYDLKDHLGNLSVSCRCAEKASLAGAAGAGIVTVVQENQYDPWGVNLPFYQISDNLAGSPTDRYQYNGKEKVDGLGLYEYGFRWYDPAAARFIQVDPLAMQYAYKSTYDYAENSPIRFIDLDGLEKFDAIWPIDMSKAPKIFNGVTTNYNLHGWQRNALWYWTQVIEKYPNALDKGNEFLVLEKGLSPRVTKNLLAHLAEQGISTNNFIIGDILDHHHVNQGRTAIAISASEHGKIPHETSSGAKVHTKSGEILAAQSGKMSPMVKRGLKKLGYLSVFMSINTVANA